MGTVTTRLRRTGWARLRTLRLTDALSWLVVVIVVIDATDAELSVAGAVGGLLGVSYRVLVATEWVQTDEDGISWRPGLVTRRVSWADIASVEISTRPVATFLRRASVPVTSLDLIRADGGTPWRPRPSEWTSLASLVEFVAAARLLSPHDWWTPATTGS